MTQSSTTETEYVTLPVSPELRTELRVSKAESGQTYDELLREHLSLPVE